MSDDRFDDALARTLTDTASTDEPCPDAAGLAAFSEHGLSTSEHASVETHVAHCLRCQAHLAALARSLDVEPISTTEHRRGLWWLDWRWVTPVAATAIIVLSVWVVDPGSIRTGSLISEDTRAPAEEVMERSVGLASPPPVELEDARGQAAPGVGLPRSTSAAPASPPPEARREAVVVQRSSAPRRADVAPERDTVAPPLLEETVDAMRARRAAALVDVAAPSDRLIVSPATGAAWRLVTGGVERSTDGGTTWTVHPLPTRSVILAGSAPSDRVCWLVGENGAILRTTDAGESWVSIPPPGPATYTDVEAQDMDTATVVSEDGTRLTTTDGGATWTSVN